jgi:hypothetical protein
MEAGSMNGKPLANKSLRFGKSVLPPLLFGTALLFASFAAAADPGETVLLLLRQMQSSYAQVNDYQAVFHKQERVEGKLLPEETIVLKYKKPQKIYMHWIGEPMNGTEALYVQGMFENKLIAHRGGVLGVITKTLDPNGPTAMKGNRHPITEVGFGFLVEKLGRDLEKAITRGEFQVIRIGEETFKGRPATVFEGKFTPGEVGKFYSSRMVIHIDREFQLPCGSAFFDEKDALFEKYSYTDVKLNIGLTDMDFSRSNKEYRF